MPTPPLLPHADRRSPAIGVTGLPGSCTAAQRECVANPVTESTTEHHELRGNVSSTIGEGVVERRWRALGFDGGPGTAVATSMAESAKLDVAYERVPTAMDVATRGIRDGSHIGMGVYASRDGESVVEAAVGWAGPGRPMTTTTMLPWFCCMKPLYTLGFALLWEAGEFELHQPVSDVIPEFGYGGKDQLTFWHLLTHTAALRPDPFYGAIWQSRDKVLETIYASELPADAIPGAEAYYGQFWAWTILSEAMDRRLGSDHRQFLRDVILEPLGIVDCLLTVGEQEWTDRGADIAPIYDTESDLAPRLFAATEHRWQYGAYGPGVIGVGSAGALGRIAETFLPRPPHPILRPQTVSALGARHRVGLWDEHWNGFVSWGLGVIVDGWMFGSRCSPNTMGHVGYNTTFFSVDPVANVVVAGASNGLCATRTSVARDHGFTDGVYADLDVPDPGQSAPRIVAVDPPEHSDVAATRARAEARYWNPSRQVDTGEQS